jgi:2-succinyl-5-enolpyruvyl-6-hydroxy-3-cyclohexene-1-carboxylate synthase
LYGCAYERPQTAGELLTAVDTSVAGDGTTIIELRTEREANLALHRRIARHRLPAS